MLREIAFALYWAEGSKPFQSGTRYNKSLVEFTNTDPIMIKLFMKFLLEEMKVDPIRLRGRIKLHNNVNLDEGQKYWSKISGIPLDQFTKPIVRDYPTKNPDPRKTVFIVRYSSQQLMEKLINGIEQLKIQLGVVV